MSLKVRDVAGMGSVDVTGRALRYAPDGARRGYDASQVITPDIFPHTTVGQRHALRVTIRYQPMVKVVWERSGDRWYWSTAEYARIRDELLTMARKRQRGLRRSMAELARWTGTTPDMVARVLKGLVARGIGTLVTGRGRYARTVFRVVARSMPQPYGVKAAALSYAAGTKAANDRMGERRYACLTPTEQARMEHDRFLWKKGLREHLAELGFEGPDAEDAYLAFMGVTRTVEPSL